MTGDYHFETLQFHAGQEKPEPAAGVRAVPIYQTASYVFRDLAQVGAAISPFNAFLLLQGIETLSLRLERHAENTKRVVAYLAARPEVERVNHPLLPGHPDHALYEKYFPKGAVLSSPLISKGDRLRPTRLSTV